MRVEPGAVTGIYFSIGGEVAKRIPGYPLAGFLSNEPAVFKECSNAVPKNTERSRFVPFFGAQGFCALTVSYSHPSNTKKTLILLGNTFEF